MKEIWDALKMLVWMILLTGIIYPLIVTGIAQVAFKERASGDFIIANGKTIGAKLIAQKFESDRYFWSRPSPNDYNPLSSGGSNLGPTSEALKKAVNDRIAVIVKASAVGKDQIPSELLFASGSGLDPHISPKGAFFQIDRIVKARGLDPQIGKKTLEDLINSKTEKRSFRVLGEPAVNVLLLNKALDELPKSLNKVKGK